MNETLDWYKVFAMCARYENYSKAAEKLFISQSAVSQSIRQLEDHVGIKLFYRQGRKMLLTVEGESLYDYIAQSINTLTDVPRYLDGMKSLDVGTLHIGASDTITRYYLMKHILAFTELYPGIKIRIDNRPSPTCIRLVEEGRVDIAFVNANSSKVSTMDFTTFDYVENCFIAHKEAGINVAHNYSTSELASYPLITLESPSSTRFQLNHFLMESKTSIEPRLEFSSMELILQCVKEGLGIGFLAKQVAKPLLDSGDVVEIKLASYIPHIPMAIVTNPKRQLSLAAKTFMTMVLDT